MPVIKLYQHGVTGGIQGGNKGLHGTRGQVQGWTTQSTRRNIQFLRSVTINKLWGNGFAVTLTLKNCPPTHEDWKKLRDIFFKRMARLGMIRAHWVTEWQRRGVPHLHAIIYFDSSEEDNPAIPFKITKSWIQIAGEYGTTFQAQHVMPIRNTLGWIQYLAKHSSRGANHYQRSPENVPEGWKTTGKIWGKYGDWSTKEPTSAELTRAQWWKFRRLVRSWRIADARNSGNEKRIYFAKKMLKKNNRTLSEVTGVSEWVTEATSMAFLHHLEQTSNPD